jgi:hypothetical protein
LIRAAVLLAAGALALLPAGRAAEAQPRGRPGPGSAQPSEIVAAELAFARLAREKGQWTAFRETAEKDAIMFVPGVVNARAWLKQQADPAEAVSWRPHRVFMACDGSYAASTGPWTRPDGTQGSFTTIWRRQQKGGYRWILDFGSATIVVPDAEEAIEGRVADCRPRGEPGPAGAGGDRKARALAGRIADPPPASGSGRSDDGTLRWSWRAEGGTRSVAVVMDYRGAALEVIREAAPLSPP